MNKLMYHVELNRKTGGGFFLRELKRKDNRD